MLFLGCSCGRCGLNPCKIIPHLLFVSSHLKQLSKRFVIMSRSNHMEPNKITMIGWVD
jgi:hypothetical protein